MRAILLAAAAATLVAACATPPDASHFTIEGAAPAAERQRIADQAEAGRQEIERFFGRDFERPPRVVAAANRAEFDAQLPAEWGMTPSQCWMVGVGAADFLAVLAPSAWAGEACEHDGNDAVHVQQIITHELTHSYHGQRNPTRDFTGMDEMGWFVEGLAVLVSGQLESRSNTAAVAIAANAAPASLAEAWSGRYRYGVCGSLVQYIDQIYGRAALVSLLDATSNQQVLERLGVTEQQLLERWRAWVVQPHS